MEAIIDWTNITRTGVSLFTFFAFQLWNNKKRSFIGKCNLLDVFFSKNLLF